MDQSTVIYPESLRSLDTATLTGAYLPLGTAFSHPIRIIKIVNKANQDLTISWDGGVHDHDFVPANTYMVYDLGCQKGTSAPSMSAPKGIQISVKGAAGVGLVYLVALAAITPDMTFA